MLIYASGNCQKCGNSLNNEILNYVTCFCENCNEEFLICKSCQKTGCPKCGKNIENNGDFMNKKGIIF